jgi:ferrous iron transport protein B
VLLRTWDRVRLFVKEAGQVIVVMVLALNLLNSLGTDGSFGNEDSERSVLSAAAKVCTPIFEPMGIQESNWPAVVGVFSGVLAKEVVVGVLDSLYGKLAQEGGGAATTDAPFDLWTALLAASATVPENLSEVTKQLLDPLGLGVGDFDDLSAAATEQEVSEGIFGAMSARFDGQIGAFAYLLFVLLYFPCVATIGAIRREAGAAWAAFVAFWTTMVAYISASIFYQVGTYSEHPGQSLVLIALLLSVLFLIILGLRRWGHRGNEKALVSAESRA